MKKNINSFFSPAFICFLWQALKSEIAENEYIFFLF